VRITSGTNRRLRLFAVTQIAASFVLLAGAGALITTLFALQRARSGMNTHNVLALHVPVNYERPPAQTLPLYKEAVRRISALPGVESVAVGTLVPWREAGAFFSAQFMVEGYAKADGEDDPRGKFRTVSPGFFAALGVPIIAGRDFNDGDRSDSEKVVIVSQSLAQRLFPNQDAVNRRFTWTDPVMKFIDVSTGPRRIIGVAADIDDENVVPEPTMAVYHPLDQEIGGGRLFVHTQTDPYAFVRPITKIIRDLSAEQPVEQAATLEDVRAEVLAPNRLNALVFSGFAGVALTIAVVGVAGVLAFSVSARTREFGVRLAIGSTPRHLLTRVLGEGAVIAGAGIAAGIVGGIALARVAGVFVQDVALPGALPLVGAASLLVAAAILASLMPAARASRVDVMQALRSE
jgi:predicted permease